MWGNCERERTRLRGQGTANCKLDCEDRVCVSMAHAIASAVKGAHIIRRCAYDTCELRLGGLDLLLLRLHLRLADLLRWHAWVLKRALGRRWRAIGTQGPFLGEHLLRRLMLLLWLVLRGRASRWWEVLLMRGIWRRRILWLLSTWWRWIVLRLMLLWLLRRRRRGRWRVRLAAWRRREKLLLAMLLICCESVGCFETQLTL